MFPTIEDTVTPCTTWFCPAQF